MEATLTAIKRKVKDKVIIKTFFQVVIFSRLTSSVSMEPTVGKPSMPILSNRSFLLSSNSKETSQLCGIDYEFIIYTDLLMMKWSNHPLVVFWLGDYCSFLLKICWYGFHWSFFLALYCLFLILN